MVNLKSILEEADTAKVIEEVNGVPLMTAADALKMSNADKVERQAMGKRPEVGNREMAPDGIGYARSRVKRAIVNPETHYDNRYRAVDVVVGADDKGNDKTKTVYEVVTDYRAVQEQASGQVYTNNIVVYTVEKSGKGVKVTGVNTINPNEFINEFKGKLDVDSMIAINKAINKMGTKAAQPDSILS